MTEAEANDAAPRWLGYAVRIAEGFKRPPGYSREDWHAEAFLGLAKGLRSFEPRPGRIEGPGAPSWWLRLSIRKHLTNCRITALRRDRPEFHRALRLDGPDRRHSAPDGDPLSLYDTTADPASPEPLGASIAAERMETLLAASNSLTGAEREALAYMLADREPTELASDRGISRQAAGETFRRVRRKLRPVLT